MVFLVCWSVLPFANKLPVIYGFKFRQAILLLLGMSLAIEKLYDHLYTVLIWPTLQALWPVTSVKSWYTLQYCQKCVTFPKRYQFLYKITIYGSPTGQKFFYTSSKSDGTCDIYNISSLQGHAWPVTEELVISAQYCVYMCVFMCGHLV